VCVCIRAALCIKQKERKGEKGRNETLLSFYEHLQQPGLSPTRYDGITFSVRDHKHVRLRFLSTVVTEFEKWIFLRWRHGGRVTAFRLFILNSDLALTSHLGITRVPLHAVNRDTFISLYKELRNSLYENLALAIIRSALNLQD